MSSFIAQFNMALYDWLILGVGGMMIGLSKTGFSGAHIVVLPFLTAIFGGKTAAGIMLPLLMTGDAMGVIYYNRHTDWRRLARILPWAVAGIVLGIGIGRYVSDIWFKRLIGIFVLTGVAFTAFRDYGGRNLPLPEKWWFRGFIGLAGGFISMIGNAGGTFMAIYFLAAGLSKNAFIGTSLWFIFILNLLKLPLQLIFWDSITAYTIRLDLVLIPSVLLGFYLGVSVMKRIPAGAFRIVIMVLTAAASLRLLI